METKMAKRYYTLVQKVDGKWTPQFGDYSREAVYEERQNLLDGWYYGERGMAKKLKVIATGDEQEMINIAIQAMNA
ncbi:MAG: hypothetical protein EHM36_05860 [Deltaproteobacteria bacterium]|nr:MAG: hypothetical protein EHM36_05860 [Deltaproteobacteria bacterium]